MNKLKPFLKQECSKQNEVTHRFPFLKTLDKQVSELMTIKTSQKLAAFDAGSCFWGSDQGKQVQKTITKTMIEKGYSPLSAQRELALLSDLFSYRTLEKMVSNSAALPGGSRWLDGHTTEISPGVFVTGFPIGPFLVIGSGNTLLPAMISAVQGLLANCPVTIRGSKVNHAIIQSIFQHLAQVEHTVLSSLLAKVHFLPLDYRDDSEAQALYRILRNGPFDAIILWGGEKALADLIPHFAVNPRHPLIIPMESLTGVVVITQAYLETATHNKEMAARQLACSMMAMGQQLCSSPTQGYFVGEWDAALDFAKAVSVELEALSSQENRQLGEISAILLDRARNQLEAAGSKVFIPLNGSAAWTLVLSRQSNSKKNSLCRIPIHKRAGVLEIIVMDQMKDVPALIAGLPKAQSHRSIKKVQTVLRLTSLDEARDLMTELRKVGVYRIVPPAYTILRHPCEPLDGRHIIGQLTRQIVLI